VLERSFTFAESIFDMLIDCLHFVQWNLAIIHIHIYLGIGEHRGEIKKRADGFICSSSNSFILPSSFSRKYSNIKKPKSSEFSYA